MPADTIMIVEDDPSVAELIGGYLGQHGFEVKVEGRGDVAEARILAERPSLVLLDVSLPGKQGLDVCKQVRGAYPGPIMMMSTTESDEVEGLEMGADGYVSKPPSPSLLVARVKALLRRTQPALSSVLEVSGLRIDPRTREVRLGERLITLTSGEFDLLWLLASNAGVALSRKQIFEHLRLCGFEVTSRSIDLRISRLRQKLIRTSGERRFIKTVRGVGYLFARR